MDAAWVKVVVLTLAECVAPEGKTVCQELNTQYYFFEEDECATVLDQLLEYRGQLDNVIVNKEKSSCLPTVMSRQTFSSSSEADRILSGTKGWGEISVDAAPKDFMQEAHEKRLGELPECDAGTDVRPCKRGLIIIEQSEPASTQVWRQEQ
jgi:hypothetical protein